MKARTDITVSKKVHCWRRLSICSTVYKRRTSPRKPTNHRVAIGGDPPSYKLQYTAICPPNTVHHTNTHLTLPLLSSCHLKGTTSTSTFSHRHLSPPPPCTPFRFYTPTNSRPWVLYEQIMPDNPADGVMHRALHSEAFTTNTAPLVKMSQ